MRRRLFCSIQIAVIALVLTLNGCGGITRLAGLSISITPAKASVQAGTTLDLLGDAKGFNEGAPVVFWSMGGGLNDPCAITRGHTPPSFSQCSCGYVIYHDQSGVPSNATYFAPPTVPSSSGTIMCPIAFSAMQLSPFYAMNASAEITVTK